MPLSPAERAGLESGDIIVSINDTRIIGGDDISSYLEEYTSPGQTIELVVERSESQLVVELILGTRPLPT